MAFGMLREISERTAQVSTCVEKRHKVGVNLGYY
jgi:hypothetical protein